MIFLKKTKKIRIVLFILLLLFIIKCVISFGTALIKGDIEFGHNHKIIGLNENISFSNIVKYNISDFTKAIEANNYKINIEMKNSCVYEKDCKINIIIDNFSDQDNYKVKYGINDNIIEINLNQKETKLTYELSEGENLLIIQIYKNDILEKDEKEKIFYVKPYEKQFLDELTENSVTTHYRTGKYENYESSINLLKSLGVNNIRTDFFWGYIYLYGKYDFSKYDKWINSLKEDSPNIKIIGILNSSASIAGNDRKINTDKELNSFVEFCVNVAKHYPEIENYEILNEPNSVYITSEDLEWYNKIILEVSEALKKVNPNIKIIQYALSAGTNDSDSYISSKTFYDRTFNEKIYMLSDSFSYNVYYDLDTKIKMHKNQFNDFGGFIKQDITEYGVSEYNGITEEEQADEIVIQSNQITKNNMQLKNIYNLWDTGTNVNQKSQNYGLIRNDYTPKPAYYAVKKYYENTNGGEYIGTVNLADGLEAHVYDKDGKPKIITWSNTKNKSIEIDYKDFTAKDIYGNDIPNTNGKLEITTSPVYLDNVSNKYYYEAISNSAIDKYSEFQNKFGTEIASVNGLQNSINSLKQYMKNIASLNAENENTAKQKMKDHFNLGNQILEAYKNGNLKVEYVKLSSMLDMLNDIGDSYEDLVTVSSKTRNPDIQGTKSLVDNAEQILNNNSDIDIVYPKKILDFSKDLYQKADYINNLTEENPIKTGLIVSNDLHAKYLANWATTFANIYVDDYIKNNPINESYSETNWTNKDVTVTLNIGNDTKITNNSGKNTYTFTNNGKFTFQYERRGRKLTKEVVVNNIDKKSPVISGVENNKTYYNAVTPKVTDEHLKEVQLKKNGQVIDGYKSGNEIKDAGKYELIGKDIAGNETKIEFEIIHKFTISSKIYSIKDKYIIGIKHNTKLKDFDKELQANEKYKISRNNKEIKDGDIIATGDILETENGQKYYLIVQGDINKDGNTNITDLVKIRRKILSMEEFDEYQTMAADLAIDNKINITDLVRIRRIILGYEL